LGRGARELGNRRSKNTTCEKKREKGIKDRGVRQSGKKNPKLSKKANLGRTASAEALQGGRLLVVTTPTKGRRDKEKDTPRRTCRPRDGKLEKGKSHKGSREKSSSTEKKELGGWENEEGGQRVSADDVYPEGKREEDCRGSTKRWQEGNGKRGRRPKRI